MRPTATAGATPINLADTVRLDARVFHTAVYDNQGPYTLHPAPTNADTDAVDGTAVLTEKPPAVSPARGVSGAAPKIVLPVADLAPAGGATPGGFVIPMSVARQPAGEWLLDPTLTSPAAASPAWQPDTPAVGEALAQDDESADAVWARSPWPLSEPASGLDALDAYFAWTVAGG